ncbi:type 1 glutamine amidotransferase [Actibacterium lipolyticum]|uniref:GMP synthase [glutamine-hydrolyzing] n=1 Tax=Actibacterium lipolyticum TaxID=1524263 RepID=A0A238KLH8_9RHOB|nr:type 1 glutamine amidotransferase [Actibacterium lipolyticum]SMX43477.1 GMP synthase [glutamine-hydrolyzing] [Actibacterium lipolyticum]
MRIGILQTGHVPETLRDAHGEYPDMFEQLLGGRGFDFRRWSVVDMQFPDSVDDADGWLITGSRHGAYDDLPFIKPLEQFVRDAYAKAVPMVGVCFGHQIIAQALGGKVEKFSGGWSVGRQTYTLNGKEVALNAWHQDQVTKLPEGATVIGTSDFCPYAALAYDDRALTVQPHPEFDAEFTGKLIRERGVGVVPDPLLKSAEATLTTQTNSLEIADMFTAFFKHSYKVHHA